MNANFNMTSVWSVIRTFLPERQYSLRHCFREYKFIFDKLTRVHGKHQALKIVKAISLAGRKVIMKYGFSNRSFHGQSSRKFGGHDLRCYYDGFPRCLPNIHRLLISRNRLRQLCGVSILQAYLFIRVSPIISFKDMTSPFEGKSELGHPGFVKFLGWFIPRWRGKLFKSIVNKLGDNQLFAGFKAGAYGTPSIAYAISDAETLLLDKYEPFLRWTARILAHFSSKSFEMVIDDIKTISFNSFRYDIKNGLGRIPRIFGKVFSLRRKDTPYRLARTIFLSDRGGKTRVITSCNYFIQSALVYIHKAFMDLLGTIAQDYTFDQDAASRVIKRWQVENRRIYSFDLTAATDRFPVLIQTEVLAIFFGRFLADAWEGLMRLPIEFEGIERKFSVGQPMGLLSSWAVFAFTHHCVIRYAAYLVGLDPFAFALYCLLGDDVIIADEKVAKMYKTIMVRWFGVKISGQKSFVPLDNTKPCSEFAKRNYSGGMEMTPLSPDMLAMARSEDPLLLVDIIVRLLLNWKIQTDAPDSFIRMLFKRVLTSEKARVGVTRYMFHPSRLHPLLWRIKGVRAHSARVYPPAKKFSVVEQRLVDDPFIFYNGATRYVRYMKLIEDLDRLRSQVNQRMGEVMAQLEEFCESYSKEWDAGFLTRPVYNKLVESVYKHPILATISDIEQKISFQRFTKLDSDYVLLTWINGYLETRQISSLGMWHAKRVYDLRFEVRNYEQVLTEQKRIADSRKRGINQLFPSCPGRYFTSEYGTDS